MKKMWKMNNKAVSPVIATILMVAITVVLAAVLYVMVMGFGGSGSEQAPAVTLTKTTMGGNAVVINIDRQVDIANVGIAINGTIMAGTIAGTGNASFVYSFVPLNANKVSTSDRLIVTTVAAGTDIQLVWMPSGATGGDKQLVGNVISY